MKETSTNASAAVEKTQTDIDGAYSTTFSTTGSADVTLSQTNNSAEVYNQVGSDLQGAMSTGYNVNTNASIHVNYSIANPTANLNFSGGGTGSDTVSASLHAAGGEVGKNGPELSWIGEEGLEYIIPTVPARRGRGISLWEQAGQALGVLDSSGNVAAHANGGIVGPSGEVRAADAIIPIQTEQQEADGSVWSVTGKENDPGRKESDQNEEIAVNAATTQAPGNNNVEIKIDMSPVIQIDGSGMDEEKIVEVLKSRIREMADELGGELAEKMTKIFANMPLVQEA